jgi:hypothetical protein
MQPTEWSKEMETHLMTKYGFNKPLDETSGDAFCSRSGKTVEIKVSLGGKNGFNFVQIRPDHAIDYYLFLVYDVHDSTHPLGRIFFFLCEANELYALLPMYGGYAHGTLSKLGPIAIDTLRGRNCEYALRPNPHASPCSKPRMLWTELIRRFHVFDENDISIML